jgi:hypothetical protein
MKEVKILIDLDKRTGLISGVEVKAKVILVPTITLLEPLLRYNVFATLFINYQMKKRVMRYSGQSQLNWSQMIIR